MSAHSAFSTRSARPSAQAAIGAITERPGARQYQRARSACVFCCRCCRILAKRYPDIKVEVALTRSRWICLEERADVAIRVGFMRESRLLARKLGESRMVVVASPGYLRRARHTKDAARSRCTTICSRFCFVKRTERLAVQDRRARHIADDAVGQFAWSATAKRCSTSPWPGMGLARLARFHVEADIEAGRLVPVLGSVQSR